MALCVLEFFCYPSESAHNEDILEVIGDSAGIVLTAAGAAVVHIIVLAGSGNDLGAHRLAAAVTGGNLFTGSLAGWVGLDSGSGVVMGTGSGNATTDALAILIAVAVGIDQRLSQIVADRALLGDLTLNGAGRCSVISLNIVVLMVRIQCATFGAASLCVIGVRLLCHGFRPGMATAGAFKALDTFGSAGRFGGNHTGSLMLVAGIVSTAVLALEVLVFVVSSTCRDDGLAIGFAAFSTCLMGVVTVSLTGRILSLHVFPGVGQLLNHSLCGKDLTADRALLAGSQAGSSTGRCNSIHNHLIVLKCINFYILPNSAAFALTLVELHTFNVAGSFLEYSDIPIVTQCIHSNILTVSTDRALKDTNCVFFTSSYFSFFCPEIQFVSMFSGGRDRFQTTQDSFTGRTLFTCCFTIFRASSRNFIHIYIIMRQFVDLFLLYLITTGALDGFSAFSGTGGSLRNGFRTGKVMPQCLNRNVFIITANCTLMDTYSRFGAGCFFTLLSPGDKFVVMLSGSWDSLQTTERLIADRALDTSSFACLRTSGRHFLHIYTGMFQLRDIYFFCFSTAGALYSLFTSSSTSSR